jgi:hypothetical protein
MMLQPNDLVTVSGAGPARDGIVFDTPSRSKVVVAVMESKRGPVFLTVHPAELTPRTEAGRNDPALRLLLRRTPSPSRGAARGGPLSGQSRSGFQRGTAHRSTGR